MPSQLNQVDSLASFHQNDALPETPAVHIVHLSDLHFATHPFLKKIVFGGMYGQDSDALDALQTQLASLEIDFLFITGDLSTWGDERSLADSTSFIRYLSQQLNLGEEQVCRIPGNHDVLIDYYRKTLKKRNYNNTCGEIDPLRLLKVKDYDIAIFSFDSTLREGVWPFTSNRGAISPSAFNNYNRVCSTVPSGAIKIVQLHHHPLPIPYKRDDGVKGYITSMTNGATFADRMQESGIHLILHGHEHFPYCCEVSYHSETGPTVLVSAGTACQRKASEWSFNYLKITPARSAARRPIITLQRYIYRETGFIRSRDATRIWGRGDGESAVDRNG
jgi:3',5'-cyclic AMP phosphodiesterase CpdA